MTIIAANYELLEVLPRVLTMERLLKLPYVDDGGARYHMVWRDGEHTLFTPLRRMGQGDYVHQIAGHPSDRFSEEWEPTPIAISINTGCIHCGKYTAPPARFDRQFLYSWGLPPRVESLGQFVKHFEDTPTHSPKGPW